MIPKSLGRWWRLRQRRWDARHLWTAFVPARMDDLVFWYGEGPYPMDWAIKLGMWHARISPHWRYPEEWEGTPEDPRVWFAREAERDG